MSTTRRPVRGSRDGSSSRPKTKRSDLVPHGPVESAPDPAAPKPSGGSYARFLWLAFALPLGFVLLVEFWNTHH